MNDPLSLPPARHFPHPSASRHSGLEGAPLKPPGPLDSSPLSLSLSQSLSPSCFRHNFSDSLLADGKTERCARWSKITVRRSRCHLTKRARVGGVRALLKVKSKRSLCYDQNLEFSYVRFDCLSWSRMTSSVKSTNGRKLAMRKKKKKCCSFAFLFHFAWCSCPQADKINEKLA